MKTIKALGSLYLMMMLHQGVGQEKIDGIWLTEKEASKIEIYEKSGVYFGKIVWLEEATDKKGNPIKDKNNPEKELRDRDLMGADLLQNLRYKNGKWHGSLYAPKRGVTLEVTLWPKDEDELNLEVSFRGFTREQVWTRSEI